jgi:spore coat protein H
MDTKSSPAALPAGSSADLPHLRARTESASGSRPGRQIQARREGGPPRYPRRSLSAAGAALGAVLAVACGSGAAPPGAADAGSVADPTVADYEAVFPADRVIRLDVRIATSDWVDMMADMESMAGAFGSNGRGPGGGPFGGGGRPTPGAGRPDGGPPAGPLPDGGFPGVPPGGIFPPFPDGGAPNGAPGGGGPGRGGNFFSRTPIYVPCTVELQGQAWQNVGIRFKGNSSLATTWGRGIYKLPFRLDFDELQDRFPEVAKQRFLGFKSLSLTNGFSDPALIRDKVMADLFRAGGVRAARTGFVQLYVDRGQGPEYFGLYNMAEVPGKTMLRAQFGNDEGNLYKPEGTGAQLATFEQASFEKKTNEDTADYSDVQRLIAALNGNRADAAHWRQELEAVFDVKTFLAWLAINTMAGNWDAYGQMAHNYYLYGDPATGGRLTWIPWDHDLSLQGVRSADLLHTSTTAAWPLIRYLLDDPEYRAQYLNELQTSVEGVLAPESARQRFSRAHELIAPFVVGNGIESGERPGFTFIEGAAAFHTGLTTLNTFVDGQAVRAREVLSSQRTSP